MSKKHNIYHGNFTKVNNQLVASNKNHYQLFLDSVEENQIVEVFMESGTDDGTIPQLAKIHACIRQIAKDTGSSFEDTKLEVKRKAGLCVKKTIEGENYMICKSFGDASKEELASVIQTIIDIGEVVGINFH